jgi:dihydroneopterin aldolase
MLCHSKRIVARALIQNFLFMFNNDHGQSHEDSILVQEIKLGKSKISVSAKLALDTTEAASRDDVQLTVDYKLLHDTLATATPDSSSLSFTDLGSSAVFSVFPALSALQLEIRSLEKSHTLGYRGMYWPLLGTSEPQELFIEDLHTRALIGVYDWERKTKQDVTLGIYVTLPSTNLHESAINRMTETTTRVRLAPCKPQYPSILNLDAT